MTTEKFDLHSRKGHYTLAAALIAIAVFLLFTKGCFGGSDTTTVTFPAVSGKTTIVKPENKPLEVDYTSGAQSGHKNGILNGKYPEYIGKNAETKVGQKEAQQWKAKADSLLNENIRMQIAFAKSKNKDSLYKKAIQINAFNHTWDNDTINATVNGLARGTVESIQLHYTIKERKQEIKTPQTVFRLLGGAEVGATKDFTKINTKVNLGLQNKKGNILTVSADSEQRFYVGYTVSIFSIKR